MLIGEDTEVLRLDAGSDKLGQHENRWEKNEAHQMKDKQSGDFRWVMPVLQDLVAFLSANGLSEEARELAEIADRISASLEAASPRS